MRFTCNGTELGWVPPAVPRMRNSQACGDRLPAAAGTLSPRAATPAGGLHPFGVFILMAGAFLPLADAFIVNVALPTIDKSLHASPATLELIVARLRRHAGPRRPPG
jgi:hypothetical protein